MGLIKRDEKNYLDKVQIFLEKNDFKVWREVIPDQCQNWNLPYRVDMIIYKNDIGFIGIEGKHINSVGQGSIFANAYLQIKEKYSNKTYFNGIKIERWCIATCIDGENYNSHERAICFIRTFLNRLNISFFEFFVDDFGFAQRIAIDRLTKNSIYIGGKYDS